MSDAAPTRRRGRLPVDLATALGPFLTSRIALLFLPLVTIGLLTPIGANSVPGWPAPAFPPSPTWHAVVTAWERFDALWFLRIAEEGYRLRDASAAFFPGYPLLARVVAFPLGGSPLAAGLFVSNAAFLGALALLHRLTRERFGDAAARGTILALCWFPTSHFFLMPYSESLFLLAAVGCLLAVSKERWDLAALAGAGAALTRSVGIVLAVALLAEAAVALRRGWRRAIGPLAAACATAAGLGAYLGWWALRGDGAAPLAFQENWGREPSLPWMTLLRGISIASERFRAGDGAYWVIDALVVVVVLAGAAWITPRLRPGQAVFLWGTLVMPLCLVFPDRPLMSMPRFVLVAFPAIWGIVDLARRLRLPPWTVPAAGAMGLGLLATLTIHGYYIF
ncbi:MAG: mannosyltransferase family protein [Actinomycetota bacterium]